MESPCRASEDPSCKLRNFVFESMGMNRETGEVKVAYIASVFQLLNLGSIPLSNHTKGFKTGFHRFLAARCRARSEKYKENSCKFLCNFVLKKDNLQDSFIFRRWLGGGAKQFSSCCESCLTKNGETKQKLILLNKPKKMCSPSQKKKNKMLKFFVPKRELHQRSSGRFFKIHQKSKTKHLKNN